MALRTTLIAAMAAVWSLGVPVAAAAEPPQTPANADLASDAARMAVLDRFYRAVAMKDEAGIADVLDGAMIWIGGKGVRFVRPASPAVPGAVFESVFGSGVRPVEEFEATASLYLPSGSHVVALGQYVGYRRTDDVLSTDFAHVFTFSDDRLIHFQPFTETAPSIGGAD
jgi:ketosteroid isomerase-like protein